MKRVLFLLPVLLLFAGCTADRKSQLESQLPELITKELRATATTSNNNARSVCERVALTNESEGHYVGEAYFQGGAHTKITVTDDGQNVQFDTAPF
ncbi:hypothetical protein IAD21_00885 [Abditibacteriota bacterium]|nr:hypothetical protein IAD21_00885 [Abditibacteriota bacterium]